ncbi:MAG: DUF805 domain-containing protein [Neisseriaceae bacterium]|nr:DUF805 domain-containing protein [Neisseriaceae bacterium]
MDEATRLQGRLLAYSVQSNRGMIMTAVGDYYAFVGRDWLGDDGPQKGMTVTFTVNEAQEATKVTALVEPLEMTGPSISAAEAMPATDIMAKAVQPPVAAKPKAGVYDPELASMSGFTEYQVQLLPETAVAPPVEGPYKGFPSIKMPTPQYYGQALKRYADFTGRASRTDFWCYMLIHINLFLSPIVIGLFVGGVVSGIGLTWACLYTVMTAVPTLAVTARRLHDMGSSGWWQLCYVFPLLGGLFVWFLCWQPSQDWLNEYGPKPD